MSKLATWLKKEKETNILREVNALKTEDPLQNWELTTEIGDGAFGTVYKARNTSDPSLVAAVKSIPISEEEDDEQYSTELLVLVRCSHQNIVSLLDCYLHNQQIYIMLEFCGVGSVERVMEELDRGLEEDAIRVITEQVAQGLKYLHRQNIIHRDVKAGNLLLTANAIVKIADFGVSALNATHSQKRLSHVGSCYWMPPEVIVCETSKDNPYDYKADIWSLGITLLELAEMKPPNFDLHPTRALIRIPKSAPPTFLYPEKWSKLFTDFLSRCLLKEPKHRPSADQLLQHKWLSGAIDNKPLRLLIAEMSAPVEETLVEAGGEGTTSASGAAATDDGFSSSSQSLNFAEKQGVLRRRSTKSSEGSGGPRFGGISVLPPAGGASTPNLLAEHDALPGLATQAGMFKQNSELNLNSSLTYLQIPQSKETEKLYKRTRSRKFVIDGEELVRHTEDLISVAEDSKTTYAQRVYRLRKEVEKEYTSLRKTELKDQKKMMARWKKERDDLLKTQRGEIEAIHKGCNAKLDKTHKERKKDLEKREKEHNLEYNGLVDSLKKEKAKLAKEHDNHRKITKKSLKKGVEPNLEPLETEEEQRLRHCERHEDLSRLQKQAMLDLETKYLEITREIVIQRAKDIFDAEMRFCGQMFDLGMEQLKVNFEMQHSHNKVKHEKEQLFTQRVLHLEEQELLKQQEVDRKNVPKKIKEDKNRRIDGINKSISLLNRSEKKKYREQFKVEQKDREEEIWREVREIQREQMTNFQSRKKGTVERCRQVQLDAEATLLETQRTKKTERTDLYEQEKRKIGRKYEEKCEAFEDRHQQNRANVEKYYQKIGNLAPGGYTLTSTPSRLHIYSVSTLGLPTRSSTISSSHSVESTQTSRSHSARSSSTSERGTSTSSKSRSRSRSLADVSRTSDSIRLNEHFGFLNDEDTATDPTTSSLRPTILLSPDLPPPPPPEDLEETMRALEETPPRHPKHHHQHHPSSRLSLEQTPTNTHHPVAEDCTPTQLQDSVESDSVTPPGPSSPSSTALSSPEPASSSSPDTASLSQPPPKPRRPSIEYRERFFSGGPEYPRLKVSSSSDNITQPTSPSLTAPAKPSRAATLARIRASPKERQHVYEDLF